MGERALLTSMCSVREECYRSTGNFLPINGQVFHSAFLSGMTGQRFNDFRTQARLNLDPNEHVTFIYDGTPVHKNPTIPGPNSELRKLPPATHSLFLNIVEQATSALKAAVKADISHPE